MNKTPNKDRLLTDGEVKELREKIYSQGKTFRSEYLREAVGFKEVA